MGIITSRTSGQEWAGAPTTSSPPDARLQYKT
jgi:hypothetical protein